MKNTFSIPATPYLLLLKVMLIGCFLYLNLPAFAQDDDDEEEDKGKKELNLHHTIEAGFSIGGQLSNDNFVYETGRLFQYTADIQVSTRVYYGLGIGLEKFDTETFIPLTASFKGLLKKKDSTPYLAAQLGYAFASNSNVNDYAGYSYQGGLLFSPGIGYKLSVKDKYSILFSVNYKHQFAMLKYETFDKQVFRDNLNFDLLSFRIGLLL